MLTLRRDTYAAITKMQRKSELEVGDKKLEVLSLESVRLRHHCDSGRAAVTVVSASAHNYNAMQRQGILWHLRSI